MAADVAGIRRGCVVAFGVAARTLGTESLVVVAETRATRRRRRRATRSRRRSPSSVAAPSACPPTSWCSCRRARCPRPRAARSGAPPRASCTRRARSGAATRLGAARRSCGWWLGAARATVRSAGARCAPRRLRRLSRARVRARWRSSSGRSVVLVPEPALRACARRGRAARSLVFAGRRAPVRAKGSSTCAAAGRSCSPQPRLVRGRARCCWPCCRATSCSWPRRRCSAGRSWAGSCAAPATSPSSAATPRRAWRRRRAWARRSPRGERVLLFPEGDVHRRRRACARSGWAPSRPRRSAACRWCRSRCAARARCCATAASFPRPGRFSLWVGAPIAPGGDGWRRCRALRDRVADAIAAHCGEPRLDLVVAGAPQDA